MAELITNEVARRLHRRRPCRTHELPLDGTPAAPWAEFVATEPAVLAQRHPLTLEAATHLVNRYGRRAADVAAYLPQHRAAARPLVPGEPDLEVEFLYQRDHEMAVFPEDSLLRRTRLGLFHKAGVRLQAHGWHSVGIPAVPHGLPSAGLNGP